MYAPSKLTIEMAIMPCPVVFGSLAAFVNPFLIRGAFAKSRSSHEYKCHLHRKGEESPNSITPVINHFYRCLVSRKHTKEDNENS